MPTSARDSQTATVLKGVVRVEALATPSEHIPALMERVKPIYLSRTYGVPLPDAGDPTQGWDSEALLDKLARMKGRLLKGGEPDREAVAKILLSDWVRGRIPFFVPPPERTAELNKAEAKKARIAGKAAKGKGKADAVEEPERQLHVTQNLGSIMQKNSFVGEDVRPLEEDGSEEDGVGEGRESEDEEEQEAEEEEEDGLAWNDVFKGDQVPDNAETDQKEPVTIFSKLGDDEAADSDGSEESSSRPQKEARMTTNKVGVFYISLYLVVWLKWMVMLMISIEKGGELLHECQREEQESQKSGRDEVATKR